MRFMAKKTTPAPSLNETIESLQAKINVSQENIQKLEGEIQTLKKSYPKGLPPYAKQRAKTILTRKAQIQKQQEMLYGQLNNFTQIQDTKDMAENNKIAYQTMKATSKELKKTQQKYKISDIEKIQEQFEDQKYDQQDINEIFQRNNDFDSIDEELDDLLAQSDDEQIYTPNYKQKQSSRGETNWINELNSLAPPKNDLNKILQ